MMLPHDWLDERRNSLKLTLCIGSLRFVLEMCEREHPGIGHGGRVTKRLDASSFGFQS
jgi:hypothetical protein